MKIALITLVGLSTGFTFVTQTNAATGPAPAAPTIVSAQEAYDFVMKAATPFLNLPALRLQAAADGGIAKAQTLLDQQMKNSEGGADDDDDDDDEAVEVEELRKKTGFSAKSVKQFQAAALSAIENQVPLLTMQDGIECSNACIASNGELPDAVVDETTDSEDTETDAAKNKDATPKIGGDPEDVEDVDDSEEDKLDDATNEDNNEVEDDDDDDDDDTEDDDDDAEDDNDAKEGRLISRLWKRIVPPSTAATAPAADAPDAMTPATDDDEEVDTFDSALSPAVDTAPKAAAPIAAPTTDTKDNKVVMSEDELLSKVETCVQSCMLNRASEITPQDLEDRRTKMEAVLRKQEL